MGPGLDSGRPGAGKTETVVWSVAGGLLMVVPSLSRRPASPSGSRNATASPEAAARTTNTRTTVPLMFLTGLADIPHMRYRRRGGRA
jgi:hypothetical protein